MKEEKVQRTNITWFHDLIKSQSNQDNMIVAQAHGLMEKFRKRNLNIRQLIYNQNFKLFKLRAFSTSIAGTLIDERKNQNQNGKKNS